MTASDSRGDSITFSRIPNELKLMIVDELQLMDVSALARTSWLSNNVLTTYLYRRARDLPRYGDGPFVILAADRGNVTALRQFIEVGASVNIRGLHQQTALQRCAAYGHVAAAQLLIDNGADVAAADRFGRTPLFDAIHARHSDDAMVRPLIGSGANIEEDRGGPGTALHSAAVYGTTSAVRTLIDHGADTSKTDRYGCTALHRAAMDGCAETVQLLLDKGLAVDATDFFGWTPLHCAARYGAAGSVEALLQSGANVNAADANRETPLHYAVIFRGVEATADRVVRLGAGMPDRLRRVRQMAADLVKRNLGGRRFTEDDLALLTGPAPFSKRRDDSIIEQLLAAGADILATNVGDRSPLLWAVMRTSYWPRLRIPPAPGKKAYFTLKMSSGGVTIVPAEGA